MSIYTEKKKPTNYSFKERYGYVLSMLSFMVSAALVFCGLFIPPAGVISGGVLAGVGEFLSLCAVAAGFDTYFTIKAKDIESRVERYINQNK